MGKFTISMAIFKFAKCNKLPEGIMIYDDIWILSPW